MITPIRIRIFMTRYWDACTWCDNMGLKRLWSRTHKMDDLLHYHAIREGDADYAVFSFADEKQAMLCKLTVGGRMLNKCRAE